MFEAGTTYDFTMIEQGFEGPADVKFGGTVVEVEWPLIRLDRGELINVASWNFVKAVPRN